MNSFLLYTLVTLLVVLIGHRLAIYRENRNAFNALANRIRRALMDNLSSPHPNCESPNSGDIVEIAESMPWYQRICFNKAVKAYQKAKGDHYDRDSYGGITYSDTQDLEKAIKRLMRFVSQR